MSSMLSIQMTRAIKRYMVALTTNEVSFYNATENNWVAYKDATVMSLPKADKVIRDHFNISCLSLVPVTIPFEIKSK